MVSLQTISALWISTLKAQIKPKTKLNLIASIICRSLTDSNQRTCAVFMSNSLSLLRHLVTTALLIIANHELFTKKLFSLNTWTGSFTL